MRFDKMLSAIGISGLLLCVPLASMSARAAGTPTTVAVLGLFFDNDNEALDPTSADERARIAKVVSALKAKLAGSGRYSVLATPPALAARMEQGQQPGTCGGCEIAYAKQIGGETVAWLTVQKVSNLILNMNLYLGDVASGRLTFVHSVDIRGNTDESWLRSLDYLLDNYLFAAGATQ